MFKENRRASGDIRHQARDQKLKKLLARRTRAIAETTGGEQGTVSGIFGMSCTVRISGTDVVCRTEPDLAVGDEVRVLEGRVVARLPRRTALSRPDPSNPHQERVLATNVDTVVVVGSWGAPPFRPGLLERVVLAAESGGAQAAVCVNKLDQRVGEEGDADLEVYRKAGYPVVLTSCESRQGIAELAEVIRGRTCVFAGHSGTGKSSLVNALFPQAQRVTGELEMKGRHTTTASALLELEDGTRLIDTPGVREFGLWQVTPEQLRQLYPEFNAVAGLCRFRDCTHVHEPDCAVRESGMGRYASYRRLLEKLD